MFTTVISAAQLSSLLTQAAPEGNNLVVLDCRAQLGVPDAGPKAWADGHLPTAQHANLETQLAAPPHSTPPAGGGRHPLPERSEFVEQCSQWGISEETQVVVYDDAGGAYAARAWWLLRWLGHANVAVLNGGIQAWQSLPEGRLSQQAAPAKRTTFTPKPALTKIASLQQVEEVVKQNSSQTEPHKEPHAKPSGPAANRATAHLIDARILPRFNGEIEPIDPVAGHIPTALCFPHANNLASDGQFLSAGELANRFRELTNLTGPETEPPLEVICYCGSGVTAAHNVLAMRIAGLPEPALYVGSWSEWSADSSRPQARVV